MFPLYPRLINVHVSSCRPQHTAAIEELDSDSSDGTVDEIIERNSYQLNEAASSSSYGFDSSLFTVAARLLKSPGVQREIVTAALSDPEVFDILAAKMDLVSNNAPPNPPPPKNTAGIHPVQVSLWHACNRLSVPCMDPLTGKAPAR